MEGGIRLQVVARKTLSNARAGAKAASLIRRSRNVEFIRLQLPACDKLCFVAANLKPEKPCPNNLTYIEFAVPIQSTTDELKLEPVSLRADLIRIEISSRTALTAQHDLRRTRITS